MQLALLIQTVDSAATSSVGASVQDSAILQVALVAIAAICGFCFSYALNIVKIKQGRLDSLTESCADLVSTVEKLRAMLDSELFKIVTPLKYGGGIENDDFEPLVSQARMCCAVCELRTRDDELASIFSKMRSRLMEPELLWQQYCIADDMTYLYDYESSIRKLPEHLDQFVSELLDRMRTITGVTPRWIIWITRLLGKVSDDTDWRKVSSSN